MIYEDFVGEVPNEFWLPLVKSDGSMKIEKYRAEYQIAGDTDSAMCKLPDAIAEGIDDMDDVMEICDDICDTTNEAFSDYIGKVFNIPEERRPVIQADREVISDKALFVTKKRYIMHVVNLEGEAVDKLKIMGLEIIKSDTSIAVKEILTEITNMILDEKTIDDVLTRVDEIKEEYKTRPIRDIAIPSGCKTLKKVQDMVKADGSMKGAHYTARAAMFYNGQCGMMDKKVMPGERIGVVYIKHPESKYVGYPLEEEHLPEWLDDLVIDYRTMWDKAYKKITNYLKSMEWDIQSRKENHRKDLFGF